MTPAVHLKCGIATKERKLGKQLITARAKSGLDLNYQIESNMYLLKKAIPTYFQFLFAYLKPLY